MGFLFFCGFIDIHALLLSVSFAGPTVEDLTLDDSLDDMRRIQRYTRTHIPVQRLVHVKMMASTAQEFGFAETQSVMLPLLPILVEDTEPLVRQNLADQLPGVTSVCASAAAGESGYAALLDSVLPILARLLGDGVAEVGSGRGRGSGSGIRESHR